MKWLDRLFKPREAAPADALYAAIVTEARRPDWYADGQVPDTIDGRFDMVAAVLALVLLRLEHEPGATAQSAFLTERFITDMDGQLREMGIGDIVVGKHIGRMMSMLGGRLGAYREARDPVALEEALVRNVYRGKAPEMAALTHVRNGFFRLSQQLDAQSVEALLRGELA